MYINAGGPIWSTAFAPSSAQIEDTDEVYTDAELDRYVVVGVSQVGHRVELNSPTDGNHVLGQSETTNNLLQVWRIHGSYTHPRKAKFPTKPIPAYLQKKMKGAADPNVVPKPKGRPRKYPKVGVDGEEGTTATPATTPARKIPAAAATPAEEDTAMDVDEDPDVTLTADVSAELVYCVALDGRGPSWSCAWSPLAPPAASKQLGLLAVVNGDGTCLILQLPKSVTESSSARRSAPSPSSSEEGFRRDTPVVAEAAVVLREVSVPGLLVCSVAWNTENAYLFSCGMSDGSLMLWDLNKSAGTAGPYQFTLDTFVACLLFLPRFSPRQAPERAAATYGGRDDSGVADPFDGRGARPAFLPLRQQPPRHLRAGGHEGEQIRVVMYCYEIGLIASNLPCCSDLESEGQHRSRVPQGLPLHHRRHRLGPHRLRLLLRRLGNHFGTYFTLCVLGARAQDERISLYLRPHAIYVPSQVTWNPLWGANMRSLFRKELYTHADVGGGLWSMDCFVNESLSFILTAASDGTVRGGYPALMTSFKPKNASALQLGRIRSVQASADGTTLEVRVESAVHVLPSAIGAETFPQSSDMAVHAVHSTHLGRMPTLSAEPAIELAPSAPSTVVKKTYKKKTPVVIDSDSDQEEVRATSARSTKKKTPAKSKNEDEAEEEEQEEISDDEDFEDELADSDSEDSAGSDAPKGKGKAKAKKTKASTKTSKASTPTAAKKPAPKSATKESVQKTPAKTVAMDFSAMHAPQPAGLRLVAYGGQSGLLRIHSFDPLRALIAPHASK